MKVVVGVKHNNELKWLYTEDVIWNLDFNFIDETLFSENIVECRKNFEVLTKDNIDDFLALLCNKVVSLEKLEEKIKTNYVEFIPALVIDFDNQVFYDNFPEPNSYESCLPENWSYSFDDVNDIVDEKNKYWIGK